MNKNLIVSVIIPTRNRANDLSEAVKSILEQNRLPEQLLIIDQSDDLDSKQVVDDLFHGSKIPIELVYVHDKTISGLVHAKKVGTEKSSGDIVMFLEDDIVLEKDYVEKLLQGFIDHPEMMGSCGVVTKIPNSSNFYRWGFNLFHRGIFYDTRVNCHGIKNLSRKKMIQSNYLSGGISAYRRAVFERVPFDTKNDFFMLEDIDFSTRAVRAFGKKKFFINVSARLDHNMSPVNRAILGPRYIRKFREYTIFYKKNKASPFDFLFFIWFLFGNIIEASLESLNSRSWGPLTGSVKGLKQGISWQVQ